MKQNGQYNPFEVETNTIHAEWWAEGATVTIKELTYADEQRLAMAGMRKDLKIPQTKKAQDGFTPTAYDMDLESLRLETMLSCIEAWTFKIPITITSLRKMSRKDGAFIMEAIDALNPDVDEEFQDSSGDSIEDGEG